MKKDFDEDKKWGWGLWYEDVEAKDVIEKCKYHQKPQEEHQRPLKIAAQLFMRY